MCESYETIKKLHDTIWFKFYPSPLPTSLLPKLSSVQKVFIVNPNIKKDIKWTNITVIATMLNKLDKLIMALSTLTANGLRHASGPVLHHLPVT